MPSPSWPTPPGSRGGKSINAHWRWRKPMARQSKPPQVKAPPDPKRIAAFEHGISAESRASILLIAKGYRILARRYRSPAGEIDIVAKRRNALVFVEVKARASYDEAVEAVTEQQQR